MRILILAARPVETGVSRGRRPRKQRHFPGCPDRSGRSTTWTPQISAGRNVEAPPADATVLFDGKDPRRQAGHRTATG